MYSFYISVKYLREVTPYFRKTSILNELGWGSNTLTRDGSLGRSGAFTDKKSISLRLCYLCRNFTAPDPQNRTFELHSPDSKSKCILRCADEQIANQWIGAIYANLHILTLHAISDANVLLSSGHPPNNSGEIKHMGWLAEQVLIKIIVHSYQIQLHKCSKKIMYDSLKQFCDSFYCIFHAEQLEIFLFTCILS